MAQLKKAGQGAMRKLQKRGSQALHDTGLSRKIGIAGGAKEEGHSSPGEAGTKELSISAMTADVLLAPIVHSNTRTCICIRTHA